MSPDNDCQRRLPHKAECFCICSCFCSPASGPPCGCRAACTPVAVKSEWEERGADFSRPLPTDRRDVFAGRWEKGSVMERLTSNSSQKPCLTLSVASASLLSSRTRLSISAALMRVVFRGCGGRGRKHSLDTLLYLTVKTNRMHLEVPVWAEVRCPGFPPWGSFCSVLPSLWASRTSLLLRHRISSHAEEEEEDRLARRLIPPIKRSAASLTPPRGRREQQRTDGNIWTERTRGDSYLATDHDVSDFWFAVAAVRLVVSCADGQDEVSGVALALSHQEAAILAFFSQQFLRLPAW